MISDGFNHAAVMHALTQPDGLVYTNPHSHITCICIKDEDESHYNYSSYVHRVDLRIKAETLLNRYGIRDRPNDDFRENDSIHSKPFSHMAIPTSTAKVHPSAEEIDENLVEFLENKEQNKSNTVLLESMMNFILDKLQSNSEKDCGYKYTFLCGSEYLGQIMNDTHLTSLSFKNTEMTNEWLYNFAKHLPRSHITSLVLPRIIDDPQTSAREYKNGDSSPTNSSLDGDKHCTKKPKITPIDAGCNEKVQNNGLEYFSSILKDTEICSLDFGGNPINLKMLSCSLVGSKVTSLSLRACKLQIDGLSFLAHIRKDTQINSIDLSENELDCQSLKIFLAGLEGTNTTSLNLSSNRIGVDGMNYFARVLKNTNMTSINISDNNLNYQSLKLFLNHLVDSKVTSLDLTNNDIGVEGLICLGKALKNTQITSLDVSGIEFNHESMQIFASCLVGSKIKHLGLQSDSIDFDEEDVLLNAIGNTQITSVNLHGVTLDLEDRNPEGTNRLERILKNPQITSIIGTGIGDNFDQFASSLIGSNITYLGLKEQNLSTDDLICLGDLLKNSNISSIDLSYNELTEEDFTTFAPFLIDSKITTLDLSGNEPTYDGIKSLGSVLKNSEIIVLSLSHCSMRCNELRHFVMCLPDSKIKSLNLSGNFICCNSFYLAFILKHTQITTLDISAQNFKGRNMDPVYFLEKFNSAKRDFNMANNLCNVDWYLMARNLKNTTIAYLEASCGVVDSEDLKYLSQGLVNSQVNKLYIHDNMIYSGAHYLAEVLKHTQISSLILGSNLIDDEGFKYLIKGLSGSQVKLLDLSRNYIHDGGIQGLAESLIDTQLVELDLRYNMISSVAAFNLSESIEKNNLNSMLININFFVGEVHVYLNLFKYQNCFIEIHESLTRKGIADYVKKVYKKNGIVQLSLKANACEESDAFLHLAGAFDDMDIDGAEITAEYLYTDGREIETISCLEKCNIGELEIDWCHLSPKFFEKMKVISLKLRYDSVCDPDCKTLQISRLQLSLINSGIVYLDLSDTVIEPVNILDVFPCSQIISLNLYDSVLGRDGFISLAKVLPATKITYIDLNSSLITFSDFKNLMNVVGNTKLCWLSLEKNFLEKHLEQGTQLSPFIVPRIDNPIEFQMRYLFKELVTLNTSKQFEFIVPRNDSRTDIIHYPRLVKFLLDSPTHKMQIYDYFYMQTKRHSLQLLNSINVFIEQIKPNFISFFNSNIMQFEEMFGYDSFVSLVKECNSSNLTDIVEFLLLHRVLYYVDDEKNFLHPFIYRMLYEHQMPMYIEKIEPNKKQQIISYFEEHSNFDGAQEILDLLK